MQRVSICEIAQLLAYVGRRDFLTQSDLAYIEDFRSPRRREEVTAWRIALRLSLHDAGFGDEALREISYNEYGAPYLVDSKICIGVSHSAKYVAIIFSDMPCAIDIESRERNFERVSTRYVSPSERALFGDECHTLSLPLLWAAKETLFKVSGDAGLDLIDDLKVLSWDKDQAMLTGTIKDNTPISLSYDLIDKQVVVYTPAASSC